MYGKLAAFSALGLAIIGIAQSAKGKPKGKRPPENPFIDKSCTQLRALEDVQDWADRVAWRRYIKAFELNPISMGMDRDQKWMAIHQYVTFSLATLPETCWPWDGNMARRTLYKSMWCAIVSDLIGRSLVDEEPDDLFTMCTNPNFDPQSPPPEGI